MSTTCCRRGEAPPSAWSLLTWEAGSHALCELPAPARLVGTPGCFSLCSGLSGRPASPQVAGLLPPAHEASLGEAGPDQGSAGGRLAPAPAAVVGAAAAAEPCLCLPSELPGVQPQGPGVHRARPAEQETGRREVRTPREARGGRLGRPPASAPGPGQWAWAPSPHWEVP